jgi:hypothetical protein
VASLQLGARAASAWVLARRVVIVKATIVESSTNVTCDESAKLCLAGWQKAWCQMCFAKGERDGYLGGWAPWVSGVAQFVEFPSLRHLCYRAPPRSSTRIAHYDVPILSIA